MREVFDRKSEDGVISIEVELDAMDNKDKFSWLFGLFLKPLESNEEINALELFLELKESIIIMLDGRAIYAGSRVVDGWHELYFYAKDPKGLEADAMKMVDGCKSESSVVKDTKWEFYAKELYPSELEFCNIESTKIIFLLEEEGDNLAVPREVEHYASFDTSTQKERFVNHALDAGFIFKDDISSEEFEHGVALTKEHSLVGKVVDGVVAELFELAKKEHGYYEGWSTTLCLT